MGNIDDEDSTAMDIKEEANRVYSELVDWEEGDFDKQWLPGKILALRDDDSVEVLCMK